MARAFHAAVASLASPLPSKNLPWLLRTKRATNKTQESDDYYGDDEGSSMFAGFTPYHLVSASASTPYAAVLSRRKPGEALTRLRSAVLAVLARARHGRSNRPLGSSSCVTGTIFGRRRGRVHLVLQTDPQAPPALAVELEAYSTGALVSEMASGLVRLALECERTTPQPGDHKKKKKRRPALVEEPTWRAYCNGRKCGYAVRRGCGAEEWRVLRAVEPVSVGAGVIPEDDHHATAGDGDMMYMRTKFERVVGSRDSEAFYMVNPDDDGCGAPELSIYLLRV